jgi:oxygen-dependent protoporphyrinogen oxidase
MERDLADVLGITEAPGSRRLTRWDRGIPQLEVGHLEMIGAIEAELAAWPRLALAGAGYRGTGIPDCIDQARAAVGKVLGPPM